MRQLGEYPGRVGVGVRQYGGGDGLRQYVDGVGVRNLSGVGGPMHMNMKWKKLKINYKRCARGSFNFLKRERERI